MAHSILIIQHVVHLSSAAVESEIDQAAKKAQEMNDALEKQMVRNRNGWHADR